MSPLYTIDVWPHGWTLSGPTDQPGLPMNALHDSMKLFPRSAEMCLDIAHHLKMANFPRVVLCIATPDQSRKWREEILEAIKAFPPQRRWWLGLDVGQSSMALFSCFCSLDLAGPARDMSRAAAPCDAADFGRCMRLLQMFPEWRARLDEVASAFRHTKWPAIIARWDELEQATAPHRSRILREIHDAKPA
jgi:hypothetical protein